MSELRLNEQFETWTWTYDDDGFPSTKTHTRLSELVEACTFTWTSIDDEVAAWTQDCEAATDGANQRDRGRRLMRIATVWDAHTRFDIHHGAPGRSTGQWLELEFESDGVVGRTWTHRPDCQPSQLIVRTNRGSDAVEVVWAWTYDASDRMASSGYAGGQHVIDAWDCPE